MRTREDALLVARRNLGVTEGPNNDNPYAAIAGHANNQPWCGSFVGAVLVTAGVTKVGEVSAWTPSIYRAFPKVARIDLQPADVMLMWFDSLGRYAHTGFVEAIFRDYVITIEGNTDVAGGRTGGRVMRKQRSYKNLAFVRPPYAPSSVRAKPPARRSDPVVAEGARGQRVLNIQRALVKHGHRVALDGDFGPATRKAVMAFQRKMGLRVDGVVGQSTWDALRLARR